MIVARHQPTLLPITLITLTSTQPPDELTKRALSTTLERIQPQHTISDFEWKGSYESSLWYMDLSRIHTTHFLIQQWDSWVINHEAWTDEFLAYDYIGAVWPWHREHRVGNGGFSLRSKRLAQFLQLSYPAPSRSEDDFICRELRPELELMGFTFAPENLANTFSSEHVWNPHSFGFHDCRNWLQILSKEELQHRIHIGLSILYITTKHEFKQLVWCNNPQGTQPT